MFKKEMNLDSQINSGYAHAYGWNVYYQTILGVCAKNSEGFVARHRAWAWALLMIIFIWIPQTASLYILWGDMDSIIDCLSTNMSIAMSIAKILVLQSQRKGKLLLNLFQLEVT